MRKIYKVTALVLLLTMLVTPTVFAKGYDASDWAQDELAEAAKLEILPSGIFEGKLKRPITRAEFSWLAVNFLTYQFYMDLNDFVDSYIKRFEITPNYEAFPDVVYGEGYGDCIYWARDVGVVSGYDDGTFKPDKEISRQEAALLLQNTYAKYGMVKIQEKGTRFREVFSDSDLCGEWAIYAAMFMYQCDVMSGTSSSTFSPLGTYTVEQSIITFLRLYKNGPYSRHGSNLTHFMEYNEMLEEVIESPNDFQTLKIRERFDIKIDDSNHYTVVFTELSGGSHGSVSRLWIVYTNAWNYSGGRREILHQLPQIPDGWQNDFDIKDIEVNEDGTSLTFTRIYEGQEHFYSIELATAKLRESE